MPPYPPKPLAGYVLGKGYEKKGKREKKPPGKNRSLTPSRALQPLLECFYLVVPLSLAGPLLDGSIHPSIPVVNPSGRIDKVVCVGAPRGTGLWSLEGPSEEGLLTAVFHNVGSTTSLLTQNKALSYGFARRTQF
jgi:hypothetical protein